MEREEEEGGGAKERVMKEKAALYCVSHYTVNAAFVFSTHSDFTSSSCHTPSHAAFIFMSGESAPERTKKG